MDDISLLPSLAKDALEQAVQYSFDQQRPDGHWVAEVSSDATFTSEYVMFKYAMGLDLDGDAIKHWLLHEQKEDGSWGLAPELPGNVSTTTEAYLALKILGVLPEEDAMVKAQHWMVRNGGVAKVRFFTRFFLATFGLFPWTAIPQLPAELILMPPSSVLNIYTLSSWARSTLIPILIVAHHRPLYPLPNGLDANNNFLDELWVNPADKNVPYAPPLSTLVKENEWVQLIFTAADGILGAADGLRNLPLRKVALRKCIDWLLEHQEKEGEWAGFFPPMHGSLWALVLEGYPLDHDVIQRGFAALERLAVHDTAGKRLTATVSPVWDTALMASSLCDAGLRSDGRICQAAAWLKCRQILGSKGDWRVYSPCRQAGGWSFEYHNQWYPDVDDTAVVVMALVKQDCRLIKSDTIAHAVTWIMGMQNHDGGWAAFDCYNDSLWLHKIPFSDMDSLCDPSSADITGRILECFGLAASSARGIAYLEKEQDKSGAWWGRWGSNYIYGTSNVLRGLHYFHKTDPRPRINKVVSAAVSWFQSIQNADGGWGETLASYDMPELAGRGPSTAAQTAWALQSLLLYQPASSPSIQRGILWLVRNQTIKSGNGASWRTDVYTGTGFPKVLYLGYPFYHHAFPVMALSKFLDAHRKRALIRLPKPIMDTLSRQCVSMMVTGSRGDVEPFLRVAVCLRDLHGLRVRMATHTCHKGLVQDQGIEFYPIAGGPEVIGKALLERRSMIRAYLEGHFTAVVSAYKTMLADCWRSTMDHAQEVLSEKLQSRPFMTDIIVTHRPILVHTHAAESLQVPLTLLSIQPDIPTADFPHPITMTKPKYQANRWFNRITYDILDFV
ncbi:squalene-hopene-cyclase [Apiospora kogelbergensis]|uniref:squalene-hopene-cyclase n=1 Tax=Apiospora kogelbergensis TaxID=1337665 RepID=UPI00312D482B